MKDPYLDENGVLKNKLNIKKDDKLQQAEANIGVANIINANDVLGMQFDNELIKRIHKHIFKDIYEWAGEYRTVPIYKEEVVIPGLSLNYSDAESIDKNLSLRLKELNSVDWKNLSKSDLCIEFARKLSKIWKVHPFRDGNTRTTLTFADMYSREKGFPFNLEYLIGDLKRVYDDKQNIIKYSIRDKFVLASLEDNECPEPEHLAIMFQKAIEKGPELKIYREDDER